MSNTINSIGSSKLFRSFILIALTALITVGCGSSRNDFVAVGGPAGPDGTLIFQEFVLASPQAAEVPSATETLTFDFFDLNDVPVYSDSQSFNTTVTVNNVPIEATSATITAYGPGGVPLASLDTPVSVVGGGVNTIIVDGSVFTPITLDALTASPNPVVLSLANGPTDTQLTLSGSFSNGDVVIFNSTTGGTATYTANNASIASVDANGLVSAVAAGSTSVDVTFSIYGQTVSLTGVAVSVDAAAGQLIIEPNELTLGTGGLISLASLNPYDFNPDVAIFQASFIPPGETEAIEVTSRVGVNFGNTSPEIVESTSFSFMELIGDGIVITANPFGSTPPYGATATMTVTYIHDGVVYSEDVPVTLETPTLTEVIVPVAEDNDNNIKLPADNVDRYAFEARAVYSNGQQIFIDYLDGTTANDDGGFYKVSFVTPATGLSFDDKYGFSDAFTTSGSGVGEVATVAIYANGDTNPIKTFDVTLIDGEVQEVALEMADTDIDPTANYKVTVTYDDPDATTLDITSSWYVVDSYNGTGVADIENLRNAATGVIRGFFTGNTEVRIDDNSGISQVDSTLNDIGLPGQDTDPNNNYVEVNVLSTVTLF